MAIRLIAVFTIVPVIEVLLLLEVGSRIGTLNTIFLIILTGILGAYLMRIQGFAVFRRMQEEIGRGIPPTTEMMEGTLILAGGLLLLTPGFFTDAVGFVFLIPKTRHYVLGKIRRAIETRIHPPDPPS